MVIWQIAVVYHMAVSSHNPISAVHANMSSSHHSHTTPHTELDAHDSADHSDDETPSPASNHDCPFLESITSAPGFVTPTIIGVTSSAELIRLLPPLDVKPIYTQLSVLDYAPSNSPPRS